MRQTSLETVTQIPRRGVFVDLAEDHDFHLRIFTTLILDPEFGDDDDDGGGGRLNMSRRFMRNV